MGFWTRVLGVDGITSNTNPPVAHNPGDPDGLELQGFDEPLDTRALPFLAPSPHDGWPSGWSTQFNTQVEVNRLVDIAWACIDTNCNVMASMPVYRTRNGRIIDPASWMRNPDETIYTSWQEFAKQLFWDYQAVGEAFVWPTVHGSDGYPLRFRVLPPWLVNVEMTKDGTREYHIGKNNVTADILHIRYKSTTDDAHGHGPLESAGYKLTTIGLLQRYATNLAETGGVPQYWIGVDRRLQRSEATDLLEQWIETRTKYAGYPAMLGSGATLNQSRTMDAKEMALLELSQFNESRIAVLLGVPPFLVGLAGASGSLTYSNIADLFDYHDRSGLRPKVRMAMEALSQWALPYGQSAELNRDDYTRLPIDKRYAAYKVGIEAGFITVDEVRAFERLHSEESAQALTGGAD